MHEAEEAERNAPLDAAYGRAVEAQRRGVELLRGDYACHARRW